MTKHVARFLIHKNNRIVLLLNVTCESANDVVFNEYFEMHHENKVIVQCTNEDKVAP